MVILVFEGVLIEIWKKHRWGMTVESTPARCKRLWWKPNRGAVTCSWCMGRYGQLMAMIFWLRSDVSFITYHRWISGSKVFFFFWRAGLSTISLNLGVLLFRQHLQKAQYGKTSRKAFRCKSSRANFHPSQMGPNISNFFGFSSSWSC